MHIIHISSLLLLPMIIGKVTKNKTNFQVPTKRYQWGDWQPHFNFVPSHVAKDHLNRPGGNISVLPEIGNGAHLDYYVVRLVHKRKLLCSGIAVSISTVLTSSLCIHDVILNEVTVKLLDGTDRKVVNVSGASGYTMDLNEERLSILTLERELPNEYSKPPQICPFVLQMPDVVELWYWNWRRTALKKKLATQVPDCKLPDTDETSNITEYGLSCLENTRVTPRCEKTFGLPYVWNGHFCGMNILGHNCPNRSNIDVYIRLIDVKSFIARTLREVRANALHSAIS